MSIIIGDAATRNYREYIANLQQSGTSAPTVTELTNTTGATAVWTRVPLTPLRYEVTFNQEIGTVDKIFVLNGGNYTSNGSAEIASLTVETITIISGTTAIAFASTIDGQESSSDIDVNGSGRYVPVLIRFYE